MFEVNTAGTIPRKLKYPEHSSLYISDHYVMAIRWFFLGSLAALSVPVTLLEPSWLGPIKALAAVDICDKDVRPHNVLPSFSPSLLARRRGTFERDL